MPVPAKLASMPVGAERKKVIALGVLLLIAVYVIYTNVFSSDSRPGSSNASPSRPAAAPNIARPVTRPAQPSSSRGEPQDFHASLKPKRPEDRVDPMSIDPTLRLDLLAKVRQVKIEGGARSLFEFSAQPAEAMLSAKPVPKIIPQARYPGPMPLPPPTPLVPLPPRPKTPIPLKFYGFINPARSGAKRAFFLDGEDIIVATEGDVIKRRYRIVRIGVNSAVVEDTEEQNQQTLPLMEEITG